MSMYCPLCGVGYEGGHSCMSRAPITFTPGVIGPLPPDDRDAKIRELELQISDLKYKLECAESVSQDYLQVCKQRDDANRLNSEMRTALEIALPSMAHTYSGHEDPSVWVDGCGKCRVASLLTNPLKRKCEWCGGTDSHASMCRNYGRKDAAPAEMPWKCAHCGSRRMSNVLYNGNAHCLDCCNNTKVN